MKRSRRFQWWTQALGYANGFRWHRGACTLFSGKTYILAMIIELGKLGSGDIHGLMTQAIIPRPIAWVLSDNGN